MKKESIKINYFLQLAYQILNMCLPFVTSPYIARILGVENIGIYSYTYSIAHLFILFINLGIEKYGCRAVAIVKDDKNKLSVMFSELLFIKLVLGAIVLVIYFVCVTFLFKYKMYFYIQSFILIGAIIDINWFFFGIEKFKVTVTRNFILKVITVICVFCLVKSSEDLWMYTIIMALGMLVSQSAVWIMVSKYVHKVKINKIGINAHFKPLLILFAAVLAQSAYTYLDKVMIGHLGTMEQLGYCENAYKIVSFPMGVITSFGVVMLPRMSALIQENNVDQASKYILKSMNYIMILAIGMMCGMIAVGKDFSVLFWGKDFAESGVIVSVIAPIVVFMSWSDVIRNQFLIPQQCDKEYTVAIIIGAIVNIISNALLIPFWGAVGAAIGTIFSYFSIAIYQTWVTRDKLPYKKFISNMIVPLFLGVAMVISIKIFQYFYADITIMRLVLEVLIGIIVYGICVAIYLVIKKEPLIIKFKR